MGRFGQSSRFEEFDVGAKRTIRFARQEKWTSRSQHAVWMRLEIVVKSESGAVKEGPFLEVINQVNQVNQVKILRLDEDVDNIVTSLFLSINSDAVLERGTPE